MKYDRFKQLWTALVTDRPRAETSEGSSQCLHNGASVKMINALVAAADDDNSAFDEVEKELAAVDLSAT